MNGINGQRIEKLWRGAFVKGLKKRNKMKSFKQFYEAKGAFKEFPVEQQPQRIPLDVYEDLTLFMYAKLKDFGQVFIPSAQKGINKKDAGDLDVIIEPYNRNTWREDIKRIFADNIIAHKSNGPQLMTVMKGLIDHNQYMVDFILSKEGSFEYRAQYAKFGTIIPAVVGSFARSLAYKFDQDQLGLRLMSRKGNYHNIPLTKDFSTALKVLMLDPKPVEQNKLYTPEEVAEWVISSPRFDSGIWKQPPDRAGQTIVTKNNKSHRSAKIRPEVKKCYEIIDSVQKSATWDNTNYRIERIIFGDEFIDSLLEKVADIEKKEDKVISGNEIMEFLGIKGGPVVGKIIRYIQDNQLNREDAYKYLKGVKDER
jgi:hypothetical protein